MQAPRPSAIAMLPLAPSAQPPSRSLGNLAPPYPAPAAAVSQAHPPVLENWPPFPAATSIYSALAGLERLYTPAFGQMPTRDAIMAADPFSAAGRVAVANQSATFAAIQARPPPHSPYSVPAPPLSPMLRRPSLLQSTPFLDKNFPRRLFEIISSEEHAHIISWLPHGKGFMIHDKPRFAETVLPRYFDGVKFASFVRRMNRWKFARVTRGAELGAYYHEHFVRNRPDLLLRMTCPMNSQFTEGTRKGKGNKGPEKVGLVKWVEDEAKEKVQEKSPLDKVQMKGSLPQVIHKPHVQMRSAPAKIKSPRSKAANNESPGSKTAKVPSPEGNGRLPSALPGTPRDANDSTTTIDRYKASPGEILANYSAIAPLQMYPPMAPRNDSIERQSKEIRRRLLLPQPVLPRNGVAPATLNASNPSYLSRSRPGITSDQAYHPAALITAQGGLPTSYIGLDMAPLGTPGAQTLRDNSRTIGEVLANGVSSGGACPVLMTQEERIEFAKYLLLKKSMSAAV